MAQHIAFRADASTRIGSGHVKRCLSLAEALMAAGLRASLVTRASDLPLAIAPQAAGVATLVHPWDRDWQAGADAGSVPHADWLNTDWQTDADQTVAALRDRHIDILVIDHYALDSRWHRRVGGALGCAVVVVDDLADRALAADLIIDHNHAEDHTSKYAAVNTLSCPILGGPRFAMLTPGFAMAARNPVDDPVRSVGIFMGGVDLPNLSASALQGLRQTAGFDGEIEIVTTRGNPHLPTLRALVDRDARASLVVDADNLIAFFGRHELHIGAGGGATWERCCLGAPTIALIAADNQRQVLLPLAHLDVIALIETESPDAAMIGQQAIELMHRADLRHALAANAKQLVDGQGCARIAHEFMTLCAR